MGALVTGQMLLTLDHKSRAHNIELTVHPKLPPYPSSIISCLIIHYPLHVTFKINNGIAECSDTE